MAVGSWQLAVGSWQLAVGSWQLAVGSWQLAVGSWQLAVGSWQLAVGSWQLAVGSWQLAVIEDGPLVPVNRFYYLWMAWYAFPRWRGCCETPKASLPYSEWEFIPLDIKGLSRRISTVEAWEPDFRNTLWSVGTRRGSGVFLYALSLEGFSLFFGEITLSCIAKTLTARLSGFSYKCLTVTYSHMGKPHTTTMDGGSAENAGAIFCLPSAIHRFTAERDRQGWRKCRLCRSN